MKMLNLSKKPTALQCVFIFLLTTFTSNVYANFERLGKGVTCYEGAEIVYDSSDTSNQRLRNNLSNILVSDSSRRNGRGETLQRYRQGEKEIVCFTRPVEPPLECRLDDNIIFSSQSSNMESFEAAKRGYTLIHMDLTETQSLYTYAPGPVYCEIELSAVGGVRSE